MDNDIILYIDNEKVQLSELIRVWHLAKAKGLTVEPDDIEASAPTVRKQEDLKEGELQW